VRITAYAVPYSTMVASIPFSVGHGMFVPIDDENCWRYFTAPKVRPNPRDLGGTRPGRGERAPCGARRFPVRPGAEKILEPDEDWRLLGTDDDPVVQEVLGIE
jgi:hypothetical protein